MDQLRPVADVVVVFAASGGADGIRPGDLSNRILHLELLFRYAVSGDYRVTHGRRRRVPPAKETSDVRIRSIRVKRPLTLGFTISARSFSADKTCGTLTTLSETLASWKHQKNPAPTIVDLRESVLAIYGTSGVELTPKQSIDVRSAISTLVNVQQLSVEARLLPSAV